MCTCLHASYIHGPETRLQTMRNTGNPAATGRINLIQSTSLTYACISYIPLFKLYKDGSDPASRTQGSTPVYARLADGSYPAGVRSIPWRMDDPNVEIVSYPTPYTYGFITFVLKCASHSLGAQTVRVP